MNPTWLPEHVLASVSSAVSLSCQCDLYMHQPGGSTWIERSIGENKSLNSFCQTSRFIDLADDQLLEWNVSEPCTVVTTLFIRVVCLFSQWRRGLKHFPPVIIHAFLGEMLIKLSLNKTFTEQVYQFMNEMCKLEQIWDQGRASMLWPCDHQPVSEERYPWGHDSCKGGVVSHWLNGQYIYLKWIFFQDLETDTWGSTLTEINTGKGSFIIP